MPCAGHHGALPEAEALALWTITVTGPVPSANRHRPTHEYPLPDASVRNGLPEVRLPARALWHSTVKVWFGGKSEMSKLISGQPGE